MIIVFVAPTRLKVLEFDKFITQVVWLYDRLNDKLNFSDIQIAFIFIRLSYLEILNLDKNSYIWRVYSNVETRGKKKRDSAVFMIGEIPPFKNVWRPIRVMPSDDVLSHLYRPVR